MVPTATDQPAVPKAVTARKRALRHLRFGLVLLIAGIAVTAITYSHASSSPTGGTYIVAWGPMLFGALRTVSGLVALRRANRSY